ncbi:MAG: hypothetical protein GF317_20040 [Candidatus Lokiarchaeota archaeon]|nr:hypothetical protein [Candidatus Lokiarchaeota archaeon]
MQGQYPVLPVDFDKTILIPNSMAPTNIISNPTGSISEMIFDQVPTRLFRVRI